MKNHGFGLALILLVNLVLFTSCATESHNPPLDSVITAHGNTDWHIDTAEEFLFGTDMNGNSTAANHVPDTWTKRHMHVGLTNTNDFYYDKNKNASGDDTNVNNGIDTAMLFFYAGHGSPESWDTLGNGAEQDYMSLGDYSTGGLLRYYWQCSCEVFAHGPRTCPNTTLEYACPGNFTRSSDSYDMRNVYERWGPVLTKDLRMACGASTLAYCHEAQTNDIWSNYNNNGYDIADSFIFGLDWWGVVPLCITTGGKNVDKTPLVTDHIFSNQPNTAGEGYYHIQYLSDFDSNSLLVLPIDIPKQMLIFKVRPWPLPDPIRQMKLVEKDNWLVSEDKIQDRGPSVRVLPLSNAIYLRGPYVFDSQIKLLDEQQYIERAIQYLREQGWLENKTYSEPTGSAQMLTSMPIGDQEKGGQIFQKNVMVTLRRTIEVNGLLVNVLGDGGVMNVQMNNDGSVSNANIVWREIVEVQGEVEIKSYEEALNEAKAQIENPDDYKLDQWIWGYREEAGNVEQTELHIVFQFCFIPKNNELMRDTPPLMIEIDGERK